MRPLKSFFIASLLFPLLVQAQENTESSAEVGLDSLSQSDKSFDFFLVNQLAFTYRCFISHNRAWSVSADVSGSASSESRDNTPGRRVQDVADNSFSISVSPQMWWLMDISSERVRLLVGAGPTFMFARRYQRVETRDQSGQPPYSSVTTWTTRTLEAGVLVTGGVEARVIQLLSLIAKYDLSATYGKETRSNNYSGGSYEDATKRWKLSLSQIRLGLGIHF
jgi:hypothetical protein